MKINKRGNILEIEEARIIYRNFSGVKGQYNREGDRDFHILIPTQEICDQLIEDGWNVKIKEPRDGYDDPLMTMKVKVKFNGRGPAAYISSGKSHTKLNEDTISMLDDIDIASVSMDIKPYDWTVNGQTGRTAYLHAINVIQNVDRFGAKYAAQESDELPF